MPQKSQSKWQAGVVLTTRNVVLAPVLQRKEVMNHKV